MNQQMKLSAARLSRRALFLLLWESDCNGRGNTRVTTFA